MLGTLAEAAEGRRILLVVAPAGSGKTTAVVQLLRSRPGPHAWLSLGESDDGPGRFMTYLAAAIAAVEPDAAERTRRLLEDGLAPEDCAAMLAEELPAGRDGGASTTSTTSRTAPPVLARAAGVLAATVAPGALVVLVSRRLLHVDLGRDVLTGAAGACPGGGARVTGDEVGALLEAHGVDARAGRGGAASGGWAAGIVFDAVRGRRAAPGAAARRPVLRVPGSRGAGALAPDVRAAVVRSAVLEIVEPPGLATLLGVPSADAVLPEICRQHLPATMDARGPALPPALPRVPAEPAATATPPGTCGRS